MNAPPVATAQRIGKRYKLDQVIIIGRVIGPDGYQTMTTWGKNRAYCDVTARIGASLIKLFEAEGMDFEHLKEDVREALRAL